MKTGVGCGRVLGDGALPERAITALGHIFRDVTAAYRSPARWPQLVTEHELLFALSSKNLAIFASRNSSSLAMFATLGIPPEGAEPVWQERVVVTKTRFYVPRSSPFAAPPQHPFVCPIVVQV